MGPSWQTKRCVLISIENMSFETSGLMSAALRVVQILVGSSSLGMTGYIMSNKCIDASGLAQTDAEKICGLRQA